MFPALQLNRGGFEFKNGILRECWHQQNQLNPTSW